MSEAPERRYSDEEIRWILRDATRRERASESATDWGDEVSGPRDGLTLGELLDVAAEVGIDPGAVARATRNLPAPRVGDTPRPRQHPFVRNVQSGFVSGRALDDRAMRAVALESERVLNARGGVRTADGVVEWRDHAKRVIVRVVREGNTTRIDVEADQTGEMVSGTGMIIAGGVIASFVAVSVVQAGFLAVPFVLAATACGTWLHAVGCSATTRERVSELLDQLEEVVRFY